MRSLFLAIREPVSLLAIPSRDLFPYAHWVRKSKTGAHVLVPLSLPTYTSVFYFLFPFCYKKIKSSRQGWKGQLQVTVVLQAQVFPLCLRSPGTSQPTLRAAGLAPPQDRWELKTCFILRGKGDMVWGLQCCEGEIGGAGKVECLTLTKEENLESHPGRTKVPITRIDVISEATRKDKKKITATLQLHPDSFPHSCG